MKVLIVGGAGFIGSHVSLFFQDLGHEVTIMSRPQSRASRLDELQFVRDGLYQRRLRRRALEGYDWLIFCAGNDLGNYSARRIGFAGRLLREGKYRRPAALFRGGEACWHCPHRIHGQLLFLRRAGKHRDHPLCPFAPSFGCGDRALLRRTSMSAAVPCRGSSDSLLA